MELLSLAILIGFLYVICLVVDAARIAFEALADKVEDFFEKKKGA